MCPAYSVQELKCGGEGLLAHLRVIVQEGHICDGVYSKSCVWIARRHSLLLCKDAQVEHIDLAPLQVTIGGSVTCSRRP